jgi:hypothetical protein
VSRAPEPVTVAPEAVGEHESHEPEPSAPLCGTYCKLTLGAVATGAAVVGGELVKDGIIIGAAATGGGQGMSAVGVAGGAVAGTVVIDGVAEHIKPPSAPTDPTQPKRAEQPASSADHRASEENAGQAAPKRGTFKGDLTRLQELAKSERADNRIGAQGELDAIERLLQEGKNVEKLPERSVPDQGDPDLLVDGELREIKTREDPLNDQWIKRQIEKANGQIETSGYGEGPQGSVDLQLRGQPETDEQLVQRAERQVLRQFHANRSRGLTAVRIYNDGRLIAEWSRIGTQVVRVYSTLP